MAGDSANPRIWLGADVYHAPVGTTAPTDIATAWSVTWLALGLLSEDGMTETRDDDTNDFHAWGGILVRTVRSKHKRTFQVTALEDNKTVWALTNPGSSALSASGITTRSVKIPTANPQAFGFQLNDGTVTKRLIVPRGEITEVGDVPYSETDIAHKELTITVYPSTANLLYTEITNDPAAVVP